MYNLATPKIFGVQYFAEEMVNMCDQRDIVVNYETNLVEVRPESKDAIFEDMKTKELKRYSVSSVFCTFQRCFVIYFCVFNLILYF